MSLQRTRLLLLPLCLLLGRQTAFCQSTEDQMLFIVDSFLVLHDPDPGDQIHETDIAERRVIRNSDSLLRIGYAGYAGVTYIFTKGFRARPDSLRNIPSTRQMSQVNRIWLLHGAAYSGPVIDWYLNGNKKLETQMVRGQVEGGQLAFYPTGELAEKAEYHHGLIDGPDTQFYPDGTVLHDGSFAEGRQDGVWEFYYPNGQVKIHTTFIKGLHLDSAVRYYSNGKPQPPYPGALTQHQAAKFVKQDSTNAEAWLLLGNWEIINGRLDAAIRSLNKALAIEPYLQLALAYRAFARIKKYNLSMPPQEKQQVCADLQKAVFLGYRTKEIYDALNTYCH
jgi:hypothetical protein